MPRNPDGCQPSSYQNLSIDLVALLDFEFNVMVSFFLIDICAAPRTNTDAVFDLFGIGDWGDAKVCVDAMDLLWFKLYYNFDKITLLGFVVDAREAGVDLTSK